MATTTPNFGWDIPQSTDLVKDGATAIAALGNDIDAALVDLKGGTTGQILSKNSNTDLDYTWINNDQGDITGVTAGTGISGGGTSGTVTITNDMATTITASGDIVVGTGSGTYDNLPIGTTGQVLTADTTVSPYKVKWATVSSGGMTLISTITASAATSVSFTSIPDTYKHLFLIWEQVFQSTNNGWWAVRLNNDSGSFYRYSGFKYRNDTAYPGQTYDSAQNKFGSGSDVGPITGTGSSSALLSDAYGSMWIYDYAQTDTGQHVQWESTSQTTSDGLNNQAFFSGVYRPTTLAKTSSIDFIRNTTQTITGTFKLYGVS